MTLKGLFCFLVVTFALVNVRAQVASGPPNSFPQIYPNMPTEAYSPIWQNYFQVTDQLPNVTWNLPRNWAGNIAVQRAGHPNDTLFFWAFEKENGSLTAGANERLDEPWGIWLNGGPGSSSMLGLLLENGPIHISNDYSIVPNNYSWDKLADYIWIDQPVGTGWSTADSTGYVADEDQMGRDFFGFLENLVKVFPSLAKRPLHITGESYAGTYIPYITKTYFGLTDPPVNLAKIAIGDGTLGSLAVFEQLPTLWTIETYPQLIGYDRDVYLYFKEQEHLCGYDLNLTYPQNGYFPSLHATPPTRESAADLLARQKSGLRKLFPVNEASLKTPRLARLLSRKRSEFLGKWKRDLRGRPNGTIDGWYGCFLFEEMLDYAINYTFPWALGPPTQQGIDVYDIPDALYPEAPQDASVFLNDIRTVSAIHAPKSKIWAKNLQYPFGSVSGGHDPSVEPMAFLTELATNATMHNVPIVIYSGNDDALVAHRGSEGLRTIQVLHILSD
jgi:carboxypeptidase D